MGQLIRNLAIFGLGAALPSASPLFAEDDPYFAQDAIKNTQNMYGPPPPVSNCSKPKEQQSENEIVVCARQNKDDEQFRVQSTAELDPDSREATNDGLPRAPDVAGDGIFKGKGISLGGPPVVAYMLDFELLPDTPEGSEADKIAKGEKAAE